MCDDDNCPYLNHFKTEYTDTDATTWDYAAEPNALHQQSIGHALNKICGYSGCVHLGTDYIPIPDCIICYPPASDLSIKVLVDDTAYAQHNSMTPFSSIMTNAETAFTLKWNKDWTFSISQTPEDDPTTTTIDERIPYEQCNLAYGQNCTCYDLCTEHHTEPYNNLEWLWTVYPHAEYPEYDLYLAITGTNMCQIDDETGEHNTDIVGMATTWQEYLTIQYVQDALQTAYIPVAERNIQHEMSHNFGCRDTGPNKQFQCTVGQPCIMGNDLDHNTNWLLKDIWCDNCLSRFDPTLH